MIWLAILLAWFALYAASVAVGAIVHWIARAYAPQLEVKR